MKESDKRMIGIRFEIPNQYGKFLKKIFEEIDLSIYDWNIIDEEVIFLDDFSLEEECYSFNEMKKILEKDMYLIFANFQLMESGKTITEIKTYRDFVDSECSILILIVDSSYVDIYSKDLNIIKRINSNAINEHYENIEYIYENVNLRDVLYFN